MRSLIILGSGRSGTSAVAGLFRHVPGVFYGYETLAPTAGNARGYYECEVVNAINNLLIRQMTGTALLDLAPASVLPFVENRFPWMHRDTRALWMAQPKKPLAWRLGYDVAHLMGRIAAHRPFCLKDPRFGFTLDLWRPHLPDDTGFLVVYRDPERTVGSMLHDATALYERPLPLTEDWAVGHWRLVYERILREREKDPERWLVVSNDDVLSGAALPAIGAFARCEVDAGHIDRKFMTAPAAPTTSAAWPDCRRMHGRLRDMSDRDLEL